MAAPTVTARQTPVGFKMPDGYQALIAFHAHPEVQFWEMSVKPGGVEGGGGVETTTMHNKKWRTKDVKHLKTLSGVSSSVAYDPDVYPTILAMINIPDSVTIHFPDGSSLAFYGFLDKFEFGDLKEGSMPEATVSIVPTNWDYNNNVEADPVYTAAVGT